jgi:hypothetical protein
MLGQLSTALRRGDLRRLVVAGAPDEQIFAALGAAETNSGAATTKERP